MKRAVLIGANGQVGSEICRLWRDSGLGHFDLVALTHADIEVTDETSLSSKLNELSPAIVINTSGFLRVDECELVPDKACRVNGMAVKDIATFCAKNDALLVHYSTDYVFSGNKTAPYTEVDAPEPINAYGVSKLMGEYFACYTLPENHLIIRTSGLFGPAGSSNKGGNFVMTMLRLAAAGRSLSVVDDQVFSPTYAPDLAEAMLSLVRQGARGTVHLTNSGTTSWYGLAARAFAESGLSPELHPVSSSEYGSAARRPAYSVLDNSRATNLGVPPLRSWEHALKEYVQRIA